MWYSKYLVLFEKPFDSVPENLISEIREKIQMTSSNDPLVSVVLIAHNEESRLLSCLWSLSENITNYPIEIIGVNNKSTDRTADVFSSVGLRWFNEEKKGPGHARTCGLEHARGRYHLCIDSDTMYPPRYIQTMTDELHKPEISGVTALWSFIPDKDHSWLGLWIYELLRNIHLRLLFIQRPELCVRGMVFGFKTELGRKIGFRTNIIRGEDGAMALGLKKYGKIKFITSRKARAVTCNGTLNTDGSLFNSFCTKFIKAMKGYQKYFTVKTEYRDQESNLLK
ncbi:MAG: glycosyltransferase family A protein [Prolixibacteraceae bacterium]